jgi:hypothetical protein
MRIVSPAKKTVSEACHDLRVGLGLEEPTFGFQLRTDFSIVLDNPVMDDGDFAGTMRVRIQLRGGATRVTV